MNTLSTQVFQVLEAFVVSPWNVLKTECGWRGVDPLNLEPQVLTALLPRLRAQVARMTDADHAAHAEASLRELVHPSSPVEYDV
jgi:hypothetical protein